jgi:prolyl-tRNA synthetase
MGCYGIGIGRTLAAIVETFHDERGIIWPDSVAPARVHIVRIGGDDDVIQASEALYQDLEKAGVEVIYDDRNESAGVKFADADLIGCPVRFTISPKTLKEESIEVKNRNQAESQLLSIKEALDMVTK